MKKKTKIESMFLLVSLFFAMNLYGENFFKVSGNEEYDVDKIYSRKCFDGRNRDFYISHLYDSDGNEIYSFYDCSPNYEQKCYCHYENGLLVSSVLKFKNSSGTTCTENLYEYDSKKRLIKQTHEYSGANVATRNGFCSCEYDDAGNLIREFVRDNADTVTTEYAYDGKGNRISKTVWNTYGKQIEHSEYAYDDYGTLISEKVLTNGSFGDEFEIEYTFTNKYSENGRLIYQKKYRKSSCGEPTWAETWFDVHGNVTKYKTSDDGRERITKYEYYDNGKKKHEKSQYSETWYNSHGDYIDDSYAWYDYDYYENGKKKIAYTCRKK